MLAAQLFDPPLQKRCRPHHHHPITPQATPAASAGPAGNGPTVFITAVSKPDSVVSLDPVIKNLNTDEQDGTVSFNAAPPPRTHGRPLELPRRGHRTRGCRQICVTVVTRPEVGRLNVVWGTVVTPLLEAQLGFCNVLDWDSAYRTIFVSDLLLLLVQ